MKKLRITKPKKQAGGIPAVVHAAEHVFEEAGIVQGTKAMLHINQFDGFDCPGCAWPDPDHHRSVVEFCENGAKAVAEEATTARCDRAFFARHSIQTMRMWDDYTIGKSGRITEPMLLKEGSDHYEPVSWDDAFKIISDELNALPSPDEAIFYTSGRTSNEAAFLYQLFVRMYGTNNLPDCSNMCHESSGVALTETVGIGKGSVTLDDFNKAEVILIIGQNPGTNHPRMLTALQQAKRRGARIVTINPLPEAGLIAFRHPQHPLDFVRPATRITDVWLQVKVNEDVALLKAMLKLLVEAEQEHPGTVFDHDFIQQHTQGYDTLLADLSRHKVADLIQQSGVDPDKVSEAADLLARHKRIIACWAMGLTQHKNAVDNIREVVNLLLLKGSIGKPGAGTCPVRGHSNVQGDRTMGIYEQPSAAFLDKLESNFGFTPPRQHGYDTVKSIEAMAAGNAKVFIGMGGNFLSATPDTFFTENALRACSLTVHVSTKLNRSHLAHGSRALILPCLGRTECDMQRDGEQFVTVENSTGVVHASKGGQEPASPHLLSEPAIVAGMAKATLKNTLLNWDELAADYDRIRELIEKTIPGFENYNHRVRKPGGFYLPNGARTKHFKTDSAKALFTINRLADHKLGKHDYLMMTIRSHDQYNTTIYGLHDRYRGIHNGRRVVFMNKADMKRANLKKGDAVDLRSLYDDEPRWAREFVVVPYNIPAHNVATYFPEANSLVPRQHVARGSGTPISKSVVVQIVKR
ncbi:MAG: FdhF/YdeP family oxidoreductase [Bacteroidia bacterium]|nr:FdhF/YdeP family oxidoreductase [Bacteroidia bacterium]